MPAGASSKFKLNIGNKAQVGHGTAYQTAGGLKRHHLMKNKHGRWVSRKKHLWGKKHGKKQLESAGFALFAKGGVGKVRRVTRRRT